ncbi:MAG: valine--tRNA ligase [Patescibacteria group bacterium]
MSDEMDKIFEPEKYEREIYRSWEEGGFFKVEIDENRQPYTIMMPPPNATGVLHIGHAVFLSVSDAIIRYKRMKGFNALWLPGTDHAAIATQTKVEKLIAKEGLNRFDLGREKFVQRVKDYVENSRSTMKKQIRATGASCDWSREAYTFSDELSVAVNTAFSKLYEKGLIYRGDRIVNWCPRCGSTLADDELEYKTEKTILYTFKYDKDFPITIATTRPETKLGDTAVAVNPEDKRYQKFIGQTLTADFCGQKLEIKIIADANVESDFGTGALGVTPAHSMVDFEMAQKNDLPVIKIIGEDGKMNEAAGDFVGMSVKEAREKVIENLRKNNLIEKEEEIEHNLSVCYRCSTPIEPLTSKQWFVDVHKKVDGWDREKIKGLNVGEKYSIKDVARLVVTNGQIELMPESFNKVYFSWMDNLRDWCISRQIWWGHRIPVWYRNNFQFPISNFQSISNFQTNNVGAQNSVPIDGKNTNQEIYVGVNPPEGEGWVQDQDTLDTWFSSALWTFSTLGWPEKTVDLSYFHPTDLMVTGREIIFQWVARMIIMSTYLMGEIPFKKVYFTGLLFDKEGRKMSKSLENIIDPMEMIEKYGADALRLSIIVGNTPGVDFKYYDEKIIGQRNFINKLWNVSRFIMGKLEPGIGGEQIDIRDIREINLTKVDKWILSKMDDLIQRTGKHLDNYRLGLAIEEINNFVWHDLADWYLEIIKFPIFNFQFSNNNVGAGRDLPDNEIQQRNRDIQKILIFILQNILVLLHPFVPFVTEVIWEKLGKGDWGRLIAQPWPEVYGFDYRDEQKEVNSIIFVISQVRQALTDAGLQTQNNLELKLVFEEKNHDGALLMETMGKMLRAVKKIDKVNSVAGDSLVVNVDDVKVGINVDESVLKERKEQEKKELVDLEKYIADLSKRLENKQFVENAPKEVVEKEREKLAKARERRSQLAINN